MTGLVLKTITGQQNGSENRLSAALGSIIKRIVKTVVGTPQTVTKVAEAVMNNCRFISGTAALG